MGKLGKTDTTDNPLTDAQRDLVAGYWIVALRLAKRFTRRHPRLRDEFESVAAWGLVQAVKAYDPSRGLAFSTYATWRIKGFLWDLAYRKRLQATIPAPTFVSAPPIDPDVSLDAATILGRLPRKHATACRLVWMESHTYKEAAKSIGCSKTTVKNLLNESRARLTGKPC
jgi:RNA polymerase sigma factor (sigma-70 family)